MMFLSSRRQRRTVTVAVSALALAASACFGGVATAAVAATAETSTPVPVDTSGGVLMSYVVNVKNPNPGQVRKVEKAVEAAGGVVVQSWPEIGVVIAHSTVEDFRGAVVKAGKNAVASVGATRTVPVTEGTPEGVQTPWGPGANGWKGKQKATNGDIEAPTTPATTTDARESQQWDMQMIGADKAHAITDGSPNVLVGVLDSGIDPDHPDLASQIDIANSVNCSAAGRPDTSPTGWYPTTSDHGTHVAGTIGAARNDVGIVGVAPGVRMASVKVVNDDGFIYPEYAVCGFMWAAQHGMDVTNNSYYIDPFTFWCGDQPDQGAALEAVTRAVAYSKSRGVTNVAAMGNDSFDLTQKLTDTASPNDAAAPIDRVINDTCKKAPLEMDGVIGVTSITKDKQLSYFSNRGYGYADVAAPGSSILSTIVSNNGWGTKSGTSMASPHVAGVAALIKSTHPDFTPDQIKAKIKADATDTPCSAPQLNRGAPCVGDAAYNSYYGDGIVDALKAVE